MEVFSVTTLDLPELQPYRTLRRPLEHRQQGIFVAEGSKVVRRLLDSGLTVLSLLMTPEWFEKIPWPPAFPAQVYLAPQKLVETIVGFRLHQGIMAVARIPDPPPLDLLLTKLHCLVAMDGIVNPENVGIIVRNSSGFGANAILVSPDTSHPYLRRAVRNSMGTVFRMPVYQLIDFTEKLIAIRNQYGTRLIAADPEGETLISDANLEGNVCLIFGNEERGISPPLKKQCDQRVAIPMKNQTDSLNVASAAAVILYEASRQR